MKRVWVVAVVLVVLLCGCRALELLREVNTPEGRARLGDHMNSAGERMKQGAGVVSVTPLAPLAPWLAGIGTVLGAVGGLLKRKQVRKGVIPDMGDVPVVTKMPGLLDSRKTKLQAIAYVVYAVVMAVTVYWPDAIPKELSALIIAGVAWVTGKNIDGIALEDSAKKSNGN